jgi:sulfate adenylyltransferase subunit 1 (EFTu-like GTPase family)
VVQLSNVEELARKFDAGIGLVESFSTFENAAVLGVMRGRGVFEVRAGDASLRPCEDADQAVKSGNDEFRVHAIRTFDRVRGEAGLHDSIGIELDDEIDVSRGDLIVRAHAAPAPTRTLEADIAWLGTAPLDSRRTYALRHTTREVRARVARITDRWNVETQDREPGSAPLEMNDIGRVSLALAQPVFVDRYDENRATGSFVLIDEATNDTVAAGMIR